MTEPWSAFVAGLIVGGASSVSLLIGALVLLGTRGKSPPLVGRPDPWRGADDLQMDRRGRLVDRKTRTMFDD